MKEVNETIYHLVESNWRCENMCVKDLVVAMYFSHDHGFFSKD